MSVGTSIVKGTGSEVLVPTSGWRVDRIVVGTEYGWVGRITTGVGGRLEVSDWGNGALNVMAGEKEM